MHTTTPEPSALANRRLWLPLTSLLLSLVPLAALWLEFALPTSGLYGTEALVLSVALYAGGVGAVVTGARALRGDQQHPPLQPAVRTAARAGVVIGVAGILLLVCAGVNLAPYLHGCSIHPNACD